jgi:hypothetical protein
MIKIFILSVLFISTISTYAFNDKSFYAGVGYFSENSIGKITQSPDGKTTTLGSITYPLILKYDRKLGSEYFWSPSFSYTVLNRKGISGFETNIWHVMFPVGSNFSYSNADWYVGPGILNRTVKGSGGNVELNNGESTSSFSVPGRAVSSRTVTLITGSSIQIENSRFAFDLITEGLLGTKRTFNLMISYQYQFSRGF